MVAPAKAWAANNGVSWTAKPPDPDALPPHWRKVLADLHRLHGGACAYLSVYFDLAVGAATVDHYTPKSKAAVSQAYHWPNFRLACRTMNTNKGAHADVLDPFTLPSGLFTLNVASGRIRINLHLAPLGSVLHAGAKSTIRRLKLNAGIHRDLRLDHLNHYLATRAMGGAAAAGALAELAVAAPFIHAEALREGW